MTLIVGAGLCGLRLATQLPDCQILEKSRGVGGRMATRRTPEARFDHGAQFYSLKPPLNELHQLWLNAGLVKTWIQSETAPRWACAEGMTGLAKKMAQSVNVRLEAKVVRLESLGARWRVELEDATTLECERLIVTAPLPQALDLLRSSHIAFDSGLNESSYAKALVALLSHVAGFAGAQGYQEWPDRAIFSVADQFSKGLCEVPAWTVTMSPKFSETHFDAEDQATLRRIETEVRGLFPNVTWREIQLKRWRYSHPLKTVGRGFAKVAEGLYLCGDGFTRGSLNGAVESANLLLTELNGGR